MESAARLVVETAKDFQTYFEHTVGKSLEGPLSLRKSRILVACGPLENIVLRARDAAKNIERCMEKSIAVTCDTKIATKEKRNRLDSKPYAFQKHQSYP